MSKEQIIKEKEKKRELYQKYIFEPIVKKNKKTI